MTIVSDIERAAADWLAELEQRSAPPERLAEFELWLANPEHELAIARLIVKELDAEIFGQAVSARTETEQTPMARAITGTKPV